jgi:hypothetical protein
MGGTGLVGLAFNKDDKYNTVADCKTDGFVINLCLWISQSLHVVCVTWKKVGRMSHSTFSKPPSVLHTTRGKKSTVRYNFQVFHCGTPSNSN